MNPLQVASNQAIIHRNLTKEMVDYWLARGISILDVDIVFDALKP